MGKGKAGGEESSVTVERWSSRCVPVCSYVGAPLCLSRSGSCSKLAGSQVGCMFSKEETGLQEKHDNILIYIFI